MIALLADPVFVVAAVVLLVGALDFLAAKFPRRRADTVLPRVDVLDPESVQRWQACVEAQEGAGQQGGLS